MKVVPPPARKPRSLRVSRSLLGPAVALLTMGMGPVAHAADAPERVVRVGFLSLNPLASSSASRIRPELAKLGYVEGKNMVLEVRHAGGDPARLPEAAAELVKLKIDVIYAVTSPAAFAAKAATQSIPIVAWAAHAAVETGLVPSLRHPGGNVTGTESMAPELDGKRIQLLKQIVPDLTRLAVIYEPADQGSPQHLKSIQGAERSLGLTTSTLPVARPQEFEAVFAAEAGKPLGAVLTLTSSMMFFNWPRIRDFAQSQRLPTLCEFRQMAENGCLVSYGATFDEITQRCAAQIDKILRGAAPGDLPVEQPTRFELVINLKTARSLGLTVPQQLLLRADAVID
jgi:putative tryptophan/tyrosine transport system substrate-binding protein